MATKRKRTSLHPTHIEEPSRPLPLSAALLLARSVALLALALLALLVALAAWFIVKATLRVDPVVGTERVWLQYGHHRPPYAQVKLDPLKYKVPGSAYDISLEAVVPVNENNLRLGNFMVSLSLVDSLGTPVLNVSRPAILDPSSISHPLHSKSRSSSSLLQYLTSLPFRFLPPNPFNRCPSSSQHTRTVLHIPLLEQVPLASTADPLFASTGKRASRWTRWTSRGDRRRKEGGPVESIFVEIGRRDAHPHFIAPEAEQPQPAEQPETKAAGVDGRAEGAIVRSHSREGERKSVVPAASHGEGRELQVYEAWIKVLVKPSGIRALVYRHPWITFAFFFPTFLTFEATAALAIYLYFVATSSSRTHQSTEEEEDRIPLFGSGLVPPTESEPPTQSATPSDYERLSAAEASPSASASELELEPISAQEDDDEGEEEDEEEAARRSVETRQRQEQLRLGRGGVGMSAVSLGLGGEGADVLEEGSAVSDVEEEEMAAAGAGAEEEEEEEAEWVKSEEGFDGNEGASDVAASATTRLTASTFGPSLAGTSSTSTTSASGAASSTATGRRAGAISQARLREGAAGGRISEE
ncbi:hypothetical protein JCM10908_003788 [Rhodotorula pacifica]|uniref:uncharacterized protein n=1 Tax=Rhodotorula pacifica TaxID=1495444 RepID=UPI00316DB123